jgi:hypothetical protein
MLEKVTASKGKTLTQIKSIHLIAISIAKSGCIWTSPPTFFIDCLGLCLLFFAGGLWHIQTRTFLPIPTHQSSVQQFYFFAMLCLTLLIFPAPFSTWVSLASSFYTLAWATHEKLEIEVNVMGQTWLTDLRFLINALVLFHMLFHEKHTLSGSAAAHWHILYKIIYISYFFAEIISIRGLHI